MLTPASLTPLLKEFLLQGSSSFWTELKAVTSRVSDGATLMQLSTLRKRGLLKQIPYLEERKKIRIALLAGVTVYPLQEFIEHFFWAEGYEALLHIGEYDNYVSEILNKNSALYMFKPEVVFIVPNATRCVYLGKLTDPEDQIEEAAVEVVDELFDLSRIVHERSGAQVLLGNFIPSCGFDLGEMRLKSLASDWSFKRFVNTKLGRHAPAHVHICDLEFLSSRKGMMVSQDPRAWFESKQIGSPELQLEIAREVTHLSHSLYKPAKKVLVLDADNTLWGGIIGEDGLEGLLLGDTSSIGQAFKAFQTYVLRLKDRGILLALCSKNEERVVREVFQKHPEMVLRETDFVSFKANWNAKPENLKEIASELNLGLDSFIFVDDSPGEIDMVNQWTPEVTTHLLGSDPALYVQELQDTRLFEVKCLTLEDSHRTIQYQAIKKSREYRQESMEEYLDSLAMEAEIKAFTKADAPRISQLINKSNQFNLTTKRRTEAEVIQLIDHHRYLTLSIRLKDRFVDHGLISVVIAEIENHSLSIETWLMSCRVLQRQVEQLALYSLVSKARERSLKKIKGIFLPTPKNGIVEEHYLKLGFSQTLATPERKEYLLDLETCELKKTRIQIATQR